MACTGIAIAALFVQLGSAAGDSTPANDAFASAQALTGATGTATGSNVSATLESGEPLHAGVTDGASVWYSWTAPGSGSTVIDTAGSSFDTILAVYTGSSLSGLTAIAGSDDYNGLHTSQVSFTATAGVTYRIAVAGYASSSAVSTGSITLNWNGQAASTTPPPPPPPPAGAPANDAFASAQALSGATGSASGSNVSATLQSGEPLHAGVSDGASVWYTWTATSSGVAVIDTAGSSFDTLLAVYTGTSLTALTAVAGNDDYNGLHTSQVSFTATTGVTYRIAVAGYASSSAVSTGSITLHWSLAPDTTAPTVTVTSPAAGSTVSGIVTLSARTADNVSVAKVEYLVNGAVARTIASPPFTPLWDSTSVPNGTVTIAARATDGAGNTTTSATVTVTVANAAPGSNPVLYAAGDIGECGSPYMAQTGLLLGLAGATVATLGDHAYASGTSTEFANCYDPTWGAVKWRTRPTLGNHDNVTPGAAGYYAYFGSSAGPAGQGYYSYNLGTWHVVVLNSECQTVSCASGSAQETWLRRDLSSSSAKCTVAYFHEPLFSSATAGQNTAVRPLWTDLYNARAELVLNGHTHMYERFAGQTPNGSLDTRNGVVEFTVGTGGDTDRNDERAATSAARNSITRNANAYGVLQLTLRSGSYDWRYLPIPGVSYSDSGSATCH